jgi:hypothetical protein
MALFKAPRYLPGGDYAKYHHPVILEAIALDLTS